MKKLFIANKVFYLVEENGYKVECNTIEFKDGGNTYGCLQMNYGNFNECFLVKVDTNNEPPTMELLEDEEFKHARRIFKNHPFTPDYDPIEIDRDDFDRGYYA